jgi:peptidoglycan-N-acetylmuramic acid deacetylase
MDTKVNGWGLGPYTDADGRPIDAVKAQNKYGKYDAYYIMPNSNTIYLTFDEGYENGYTGQILDTLKEKGVKAVFFVTMSYVKSEPKLVQRMIDEGHVVGNHSVKHKSMPTLSIDRMVKEVMDLHDYMLEHFGYEMNLFRPPMGEFSQQSLAVLQNLGYKTVEWSFAYYDYDPENQPTHEKAYNKIVDAAHGGALYLLHAVSEANTAVLGDVIDEFRNQGYDFALVQ